MMTNKHLEKIALAIGLIFVGFLALVPEVYRPEGAWGVGIGSILLGLNAARYRAGQPMSHFSLIAGGILLAAGLSDFIGFAFPVFPVLLIGAGLVLVLRGLREEDPLPKEKQVPQT